MNRILKNTPKEYLVQKINHSYPPYNKSENFESYFYNYFISNEIKSNLTYIPIQWTEFHSQNGFGEKKEEIQNFIDTKIQKDMRYFTIVQYAGGPLIKLKNCIIFSQGGVFDNYNSTVVPLPLITKERVVHGNKKKIYKASYIGRETHPIRKKMENQLSNTKGFSIVNLESMNAEFSDSEFNNFKEIVSSAYFSLCPRGYGPTSFRLYESISLGSIPVYISDDFLLPFKELIDWDKIALLIRPREIKQIDKIISNLLENGSYKEMLSYGIECQKKYFNFDFMKDYVLEKISTL